MSDHLDAMARMAARIEADRAGPGREAWEAAKSLRKSAIAQAESLRSVGLGTMSREDIRRAAGNCRPVEHLPSEWAHLDHDALCGIVASSANAIAAMRTAMDEYDARWREMSSAVFALLYLQDLCDGEYVSRVCAEGRLAKLAGIRLDSSVDAARSDVRRGRQR